MTLIVEDIYYKGKYFERYECEIPETENESEITKHLCESLDIFTSLSK